MKQVESYTAHKREGILLNANECWHGLDRELTEKVIAENADGFTLNLPKHSTAVFLLEHTFA